MADKHFRLVCFVVNICPEPLRELFIKLAKKDAGSFYTTIDGYLAHRLRDVMQLTIDKKIREDQYNLLYPGHGTADVDQWDVTLLVTMITEMFPTDIQPLDKFHMKNEIRDIRNQLQHLPNTSTMTDDDFEDFWGRLEAAAMAIAKQVFSADREESFRKKIENAKGNDLPNHLESLRQWYEQIIKQMKTKLDEIESHTNETTSILRQVTVQKPGPSGDKNKRIKTADDILARLQAGFEITMKELPESFNAPSEVDDIRTKLRDSHHVVVTGRYNSRYFETALAAINGMGYNFKRSVEMHTSSDWRHIDPEDVDLVLCRNPFGRFSYDDNKSKSMSDIFNSMIHTTKGDGDKTLDIIIVTDSEILTKCKQLHDHDILEDVVNVFEDTSETHPADLTLESGNQDVHSTCSAASNNLKDMTNNFLKQYRICSGQVDEEILSNARLKFKANKAVVLTGPRKCGKTSVAVAMASFYDPSQCILLTEPNDFKIIDLKNTCLIIIDEFAGKYCYNKKYVHKWYDMFDHLYNAITAGQMNVIITCEKSKLDKCCEEISTHPLLEHRVTMPDRTIVIKQEMIELQNTDGTLSVMDNSVGSVSHSATMEVSRMESVGAFNTPSGNKAMPILRWPQAGTDRDQYTSFIGTTGPVQNFMTSRNLIPTTRNSIIPAHALSTERGDIVGNNVGSTEQGTKEAFSVWYTNGDIGKTISRMPQPDRVQNISFSGIEMPASMQNSMASFYNKKQVLPAQYISTERGDGTGPQLLICGHQRVTDNQPYIPSAERKSSPHVWSIKEKHKSNIRVDSDRSTCFIRGCCLLPSGEILITDNCNISLKKLDAKYNVTSVCKLPADPYNVCYIGNNVAVVVLNCKLQFVDIRGGMALTKSVHTSHFCYGLAYHNSQLYAIDYNSVYIYSKDGLEERILYTHQSRACFNNIALSDDGSLIYILTLKNELITIDGSGNHLYTFTDSEFYGLNAVCVDDKGHVLVTCHISDKILQLSSDCKKTLGIISLGPDITDWILTLCFDKEKTALIAASFDDNIWVLKLQ